MEIYNIDKLNTKKNDNTLTLLERKNKMNKLDELVELMEKINRLELKNKLIEMNDDDIEEIYESVKDRSFFESGTREHAEYNVKTDIESELRERELHDKRKRSIILAIRNNVDEDKMMDRIRRMNISETKRIKNDWRLLNLIEEKAKNGWKNAILMKEWWIKWGYIDEVKPSEVKTSVKENRLVEKIIKNIREETQYEVSDSLYEIMEKGEVYEMRKSKTFWQTLIDNNHKKSVKWIRTIFNVYNITPVE